MVKQKKKTLPKPAKTTEKPEVQEEKITTKEIEMPQEVDFYISGLHKETTVKVLQDYFEDHGEISSIKILEKSSRKNRGVGFIKFISCDVDSVLALNDSELLGRRIKVRLPSHTSKQTQEKIESNVVFVGNIPFNSTEDTIGQYFSKCGDIFEVRIARNSDMTLREFCYIEFTNVESVTNALGFNGTLLEGKVLKVGVGEKLRPVVSSFIRPYKWNLEL